MSRAWRLADLSNRQFGRWTVLRRAPNADKTTRWWCRCACEARAAVRACHLTSGASVSCGCEREEKSALRRFKHGHSQRMTPTYRSWKSMRQRCENKQCRAYPHYGGIGVKVCRRWARFENFLVDMGERPPGTSLDRFPDKWGDYRPSNCRWGTPSEQAINRRPRGAIEHFIKTGERRG